MTDLDDIFTKLSQQLDSSPDKKDTWLQEAKESILQWIQQKNLSIFDDLLTQMKPLEFENI